METLSQVAIAALGMVLFASAQAAARGDVYGADGRRVGPFLPLTVLGEAALAKVGGQLVVLPLNQIQVPDSGGNLLPRWLPSPGGPTSVHYEQADCTGSAWIVLKNIVGGTAPAAFDGPSSALKLSVGKFPLTGFSAMSEYTSGSCRVNSIESQGYPVIQRLNVSDLFAVPMTLR